MVKKKGFGGTKLEVKEVLAPEPPKAAPKAWVGGAGKAAQALAKPTAAAAPVAPRGPPAAGKWGQGGPLGLAATATSLQQSAHPKAQFAPAPRAGPAAQKPSLGLRKTEGAKLDDSDFVELSRPLTSAEKTAEKAAQLQVAAQVDAFPACSSPEEALEALCARASSASAPAPAATAGGLEGRLTSGLGWLLREGLLRAVSVRNGALVLRAGQLVVDGYAPRGHLQAIQGLLEAHFAEQQRKAKPSPDELEVNGLVDAALYGSLALHFPEGDAKVAAIQLRLIRRLAKASTSPGVQQGLAEALQRLAGAVGGAAELAAKALLESLAASGQESTRRGVALGVGSVARGAGVGSLKKLGVMQFIKDAVKEEGKAAAGRRQGALLCLNALALALEQGFEPHAVASVPLLLQCCSDPAREVQLASREAMRSVVAKMSPMGIRMLVTPIVKGLADKGWRTRLSALEVLESCVASMAADGPKRLAALLPKIIPPLCEAAAESRSEIRSTAKEAFERIASAVQHVDFKPLAPALLGALTEPGDATTARALDVLLEAVFTTFLDAASLALICPVIGRGLAHGSPGARRKAGGLVRGLTSLVTEELAPFLIPLWAPVKAALVDRAPEVRAAAAGALGSLAGTLPDEEADWAPYLKGVLEGSADSAELDGAALGLCSVFATLPGERQAELLAELVEPQPRKGLLGRIGVFVHLPSALGPEYAAVMPTVLPLLIEGLGDEQAEISKVSEQAFSAACEIGTKVGPEQLTDALTDASTSSRSQVRASTAGLAGKLLKNLGTRYAPACREKLLVLVVMAQSDGDRDVRAAADRVWRQAVEGPPARTLRGLRRVFLDRFGQDIASGDDRLAAVAGWCALDLQRRMNEEGVLGDAGGALMDALHGGPAAARRSACVALREVLRAKEGQELLGARVAPSVQELLGDPDEAVRAAAARCAAAAPAAGVTTPLLDSICSCRGDPAPEELLGLQELLRAQGGSVLPELLACASSPPLSAGKVACLAAVTAAPPAALAKTLPELFRALHAAAAGLGGPPACSGLLAAVGDIAAQLDEDGSTRAASMLVPDLAAGSADCADAAARVLGALLIGAKRLPADPAGILQALLPGAIAGSAPCADALAAVQKAYGPAALASEVSQIHAALSKGTPGGEGGEVAREAFEALLPITQHGLTGPLRRVAIASQILLVQRTSDQAVRGAATKLAGPMLRAMAADADPEFASALVDGLNSLFARDAAALRALAPAIQVGLLKYLDDKWPGSLHDKVALALGGLAGIAMKPEALVKAICKHPPRASHLRALERVVEGLPQAAASPELLEQVQSYREALGDTAHAGTDGFR